MGMFFIALFGFIVFAILILVVKTSVMNSMLRTIREGNESKIKSMVEDYSMWSAIGLVLTISWLLSVGLHFLIFLFA